MTLRQKLDVWLDQSWVINTVMAVIIFNAVLLGMETSPALMAEAGPLIIALDTACLGFFIAELLLKIFARGTRFFKSGWNLFDFAIVTAALIPGSQTMSVLRALRILRVLRVISVAPRLRRVVEGFVTALPGMASVFLLMAIIFYIGAVIATKLFASSFPDWFGSLPLSGYTLFQIMTLESWSMGIVRPVMDVYPYAWAFFVPFIMITTFAVVNLLVGLIVNSMQDAHQEEAGAVTDAYRDEVLTRLIAIEKRLEEKSDK
ncbi:ion transporter [Roseobacter sp. A03A-229]